MIRAFVLGAACLWFAGSAPASAAPCTYTQPQLQSRIDSSIKTGVPGGIVAPTLHDVMTDQNNCYLNVGGVNSLPYDNPSSLAASVIPSNVTDVSVRTVVGTSASPVVGTCGLSYHIGTSSPTGVYGEVLNTPSGVYWEPRHSNSPVKACEFGTVGDGTFTSSGSNFTATANGTSTLAVTGAASYVAAGYQVTCLNWHSTSCPLTGAVTVTGIGGTNTVNISQTMAAGTYTMVGWTPMAGAYVGGTDNTTAIQASFNYALQNGFAEVQIPEGRYLISNTLQMGWGNSFYSLRVSGSPNGAVYAPGTAGVTIICSMTDRPCVNVQGGREDAFVGIGLFGPNYAYAAYGQTYNIAL